MAALENYIKSYFGIVGQDDLLTIANLFTRTDVKKGDYFLKSGKYCDKLAFVEDGLLRVFAQTDTKEVTQWISTTGYFVTDLSSFIFKTPARWTIQALVDTDIFYIKHADYLQIKNLVPTWPELEKLFIARCFTIMEDRIFSLLSLSAEERYKLLFEQNSDLFNQVPLQFLASMLGMTAETFSRIRNKQANKIS